MNPRRVIAPGTPAIVSTIAASPTGGVVVGAVLMLLPGAPSLWLDETVSIAVARLDWSSMWSIMSSKEGNGGLYYVALHLWRFAGESETWMRLLSVGAALGTIGLTYLLGRRLFGRAAGALAAVIVAVNGLFVTEATELRGYALTTLLVTTSCLLLVKAVRGSSRWAWVAYGVVAALSLYGHLFAAFVIAGQLLSLSVAGVRRRDVAAGVGVIAILAIPIGVFAVTNGGQIGWIGAPTVEKIAGTVLVVAGGLAGGRATAPVDRLLGGGLALLYAAGLVLIARDALRARRGRRDDAWPYALLFSSTVVPVVVALAVSLALQPVFYYKYFSLVVPMLAVLVAAGFVRVPRRAVATGVAVTLCVLGAVTIGKCYGDCNRENWSDASAYIVRAATFEDAAVLYAPEIRTAYDYYVQNGLQVPHVVYPHVPYVSPGYDSIGEPSRELARQTAAEYDRVWLVLGHVDALAGRLRGWFEAEMGPPEEHSYKGVRVLLFSTV